MGYSLPHFTQINLSGRSEFRSDLHIGQAKISNSFLQTILANSITIVPGSISLDLKGDTITVLRFIEKTNVPKDPEIAGEMLKGKLEKTLLKMER